MIPARPGQSASVEPPSPGQGRNELGYALHPALDSRRKMPRRLTGPPARGRPRQSWGGPLTSPRLRALRELSATFRTVSDKSLLTSTDQQSPTTPWFSTSSVRRNPGGSLNHTCWVSESTSLGQKPRICISNGSQGLLRRRVLRPGFENPRPKYAPLSSWCIKDVLRQSRCP